jgi:hypothetical protein
MAHRGARMSDFSMANLYSGKIIGHRQSRCCIDSIGEFATLGSLAARFIAAKGLPPPVLLVLVAAPWR